jgi:hypothetical protein
VLSHARRAAGRPFWRRWFGESREEGFAHAVRSFATSLNLLLDVPPTMIGRGELAGIGTLVDQVVARIDAEIEESDDPTAEAVAALAPAIYSIRTRYEALYKRGATKPE